MYGIKHIIHRYPEPGHSFLPCDLAFGIIEKKEENLSMFTYQQLIRNLSKIHVHILT